MPKRRKSYLLSLAVIVAGTAASLYFKSPIWVIFVSGIISIIQTRSEPGIPKDIRPLDIILLIAFAGVLIGLTFLNKPVLDKAIESGAFTWIVGLLLLVGITTNYFRGKQN